jgi:hypothetical protein
MAVMASFTPVDVVRLAAGSPLRVPDQDLQPVADALTIHLASAAPILRVDLSDVNSAPVFSIGLITKAKKLSINDHLDLAGPEERPRGHRRGLQGLLAFPGGAL